MPRAPAGTMGAAVRSQPALEPMVAHALERVRARRLTTADDPWVIMHGILAFGADLRILERGSGEMTSALEFIAQRATIRREGREVALLTETSGYPHFLFDRAAQGHENQFLMIFAEAGVPASFPLRTGAGRQVRLTDLLGQATAVFHRRQHPAWTSVAFLHYLGPFATWRNALGERYSTADLLDILLSYEDDIEGGTHRLYGLAYALCRLREAEAKEPGGLPAEEQARRSVLERQPALRAVLRQRIRAAEAWRRADGLYAGAWWAAEARQGEGPDGDDDVLLKTGHMLEWLTLACGSPPCREDWLGETAGGLARRILRSVVEHAAPGPLYHAAHGLRLWRRTRLHATGGVTQCGLGEAERRPR
ncbi:MAG: hypothetical protein HYY96_00770 [Candidatus Tectomicrobia bacterium]|nr:hypothetical protein [Candidatus Tectomicrobia bacterium]